jgi:hypothetical protein
MEADALKSCNMCFSQRLHIDQRIIFAFYKKWQSFKVQKLRNLWKSKYSSSYLMMHFTTNFLSVHWTLSLDENFQWLENFVENKKFE